MKTNTMLTVIMLALFMNGCACNFQPGTGEKVGQIVKINKQGVFRDTWEAQLIRGGLAGGNGAFGTQPFDFTVENYADVEQLRGFMRSQQEVRISYRMEGIYSLFRSDSAGHFLVEITAITNSPTHQ